MRFVAFLILFSLFSSCKKDVIEFTIEGTISDSSLGGGLQSGTIKLFKIPAGGGLPDLVTSVTSDATGKYSITFQRDKSEEYRIVFEKSDYFSEEFTIYFSQLSTNEAYVHNFSVEARSEIKWIIRNVNPQNTADQVTIQKLNGRTDCEDCCPITSYEYTGSVYNDTLSCAVAGNKYVRFYIVNLATEIHLDSVLCPSFGVAEYVVEF
ncbi:hypothetical protein [Wandonia haliotis]|uniref:hypothetical protein n=1 Tax=Wandonia haliotis TaxID=574963 RepID=UPI0031E3B4A7